MWKILRPPKHKPPVAAEKIDKEYKRLRLQVFIGIFIGYAGYYLVRKNFTLAMPHLVEMGFDKGDLGIALSANAIAYGLSKFLMGGVSDRSNARVFLPLGLVLSALVTMFLGTSAGISSIIMMFITQFLIGWFQGMGWPPCGRVMTHWFSQNERGTKMSVWNTSHSIGAGLAIIFCGYVVSLNWGAWFDASSILSQHWRWCFLLPATIAILGAAVVWAFVRDTPSSVGLPELKTGKAAPADAKPHTKAEEKAEHKAFLRRKVFLNPTIWIIAVGNFFVYIVRFAVLDWGPTMLKEHLHMDISHAGWTVAAFEIAGIAGMLAAGWATDRFFGGRAPRTCVICMLMTALCLVGLYTLNEHTPLAVAIAILMSAGFFIYGPQALVGIAAANIATKRAAATAGGFCGLFGYGSTIVSGWGMGILCLLYTSPSPRDCS